MRILVTGANGFAGLHLLEELSGRGHEISAGVLGEPGAHAARSVGPDVLWLPLDVTSDDAVRAAVRASRPDQVYHLAGQASVGESFRAPRRTWDVNATGTLRVLEALREERLRARLLLTSSAEVYGPVAAADQPIGESCPLRPLSPYGASKAAAEVVGVQFALSGVVEVVIARSFNHIGPGQDELFVLPSFARQLMRMRRGEEEPVLRVGNLEVYRDFLDVRDGVRGYLSIMERGVSGEAYNVCSGVAVSLAEVVQRLVDLSRTNARCELDPERVRPVDIPMLRGDSTRLRALGWAPAVTLEHSLAQLLQEADARLNGNG